MRFPRTPGVYMILCHPTGKIYIGATVRLGARRCQHWRELRLGIHGNRYLQRAWTKYGEDAFSFHVLEHCEQADVFEREVWWAVTCIDFRHDFNIQRPSGKRGGGPWSEDRRRRHSETMKGRPLTEAQRAALDAGRNSRGPDERREWARKMGLSNRGKKRTEGFRRRCSERMTGVLHSGGPRSSKWSDSHWLTAGLRIKTNGEATRAVAADLGIPISTIQNWLAAGYYPHTQFAGAVTQ